MKKTLMAMLGVAFLYGCGASNKGLDAPIEGGNPKAFMENCAKIHAELKDTNPAEWFAMRYDDGRNSGMFDLSQPRDQINFQTTIPLVCNNVAGTVKGAAVQENITLRTYREVYVWWKKSGIDAAVAEIKYEQDHQGDLTVAALRERIARRLDELKRDQRAYTGLTGKSYGPQEINLSSADKPAANPATQPEQTVAPVAAPTPMQSEAPQVAEPRPQQVQPVAPTAPPTSVPPAVANAIEQTGLCKGLDLAAHAAQIECLDRKYSSSDKQLNDAYKELMAGFDESRKSSLKKEQIAWIREKEAKCQTGGKDGGGGVATLANAECKLRFTEQRLGLLKNYK